MGYRTVGPVLAGLLLACSSVSLRAQDVAEMQPGHHHMIFTRARAGTAADSARALAVVHRLRAAIAPYQTLASAEAAGYRSRLPEAMQQRRKMLHVGRPKSRARNARFDPASPQALLYRRDESGNLQLAGAMFVAPDGATEDDLDARIPLSVARWHQHTNVCRGPKGEMQPRLLRATSQSACEAAGGRFRSTSRYMVHVMVDAGDDLAAAFPQRPDRD
ncbi:MAG TPA: hypothetical protein VJQ44_11665 [Gemmatimonadales bacterium]|nr:hypothetical protein [Gemmatimonadales bacterium]